jgi:hypothetical protein
MVVEFNFDLFAIGTGSRRGAGSRRTAAQGAGRHPARISAGQGFGGGVQMSPRPFRLRSSIGHRPQVFPKIS